MDRKGSLFFHFSNEIDALFECFSNKVKECHPFDLKYVVVPSIAAKNSLRSKVAKSLGICMGLDFCSMQPLIHKMIGLLFPSIKIESHLDLALKIELKIKEIIQTGSIQSEKFAPLLSYLTGEGPIDPLKLTTLSDHLASLFVTYSLYSKDLKCDWAPNLKEHWQKELWEMVFDPSDYYYDPYQVLDLEVGSIENPPSLFVFNTSFMPRPYFLFLKHISQKIQVEFFQLSICSYYWTDTQSDFEKSVYLKRLKKMQVPDLEIKDLKGYLAHSNSLLANYGKLGREWFKIIEQEDFQSKEYYFAPKDILNIPAYEKGANLSEIAFNENPLTLLNALKADLLLISSKGERIDISNDPSIQVHQASTYQREVEILYDNLMELFEKKDHLKPSDVTVYAPKVENYLPYLKMMFEKQENGIEISIQNVPFSAHNLALKGFFLLIDLASNRWDVNQILELFHHPAFKCRFGISEEMLKDWVSWTEEVGVSFGYDQKDQKKELKEQYQEITEEGELLPSFEELIHCLLKFLCQKHERHVTIENISSIDFSSSDSINLLIEILESLKEDLEVLQKNEMSLESWATYLECLFEAYFSFEGSELSNYSKILNRIAAYRSHFVGKRKELFTFKTIYYFLKKDLKDLEGAAGASGQQTLSVYSLKNSPAIDSKIIYIMGLNDLEFPRPKVENPLCLMSHFLGKEFHPLSMEYDRYLFLEMILSAREGLFLSYLGYSSETFKEIEPSILISELLSYLDKRFTIDKEKPSNVITYHHPHLSFSHQNFNNENYHLKSYHLAQSYYGPKPSINTGIITQFLEGKKIENPIYLPKEQKVILLHHLSLLARNSIQFSLNRFHQVFLEKESLTHSDQNFSISNLQKALLKKELFKNKTMPLKEGFPKGAFKEIAQDSLQKEWDETQDFLRDQHLKFDDFFSVEFREDIKEAEKVHDSLWVLPCPQIEDKILGRVKIKGLLEDVSSRGLLCYRTLNEESMLLEWPRYLIYTLLKDRLPIDFEPHLLFSKSKKIKPLVIDNPAARLEKYLQFYLLSQNYLLPFLPAWIPYFMKYQPDEIIMRMKKDLESPYFYNQYTKILMEDQTLKESVVDLWQKMGQKLFKETYSFIHQ